MAAVTPLQLRVEGMDCSACAVKIENAMKRLPGVSDIDVSYGLQRLSLAVDHDRTSRSTIEARIRALGYVPKRLGHDASPLQILATRAPMLPMPTRPSVRSRSCPYCRSHRAE